MVRIRILEHDNVAALERPVRKQLFIPRPAASEDEFVDEQMIADEQSPFHGGGRNLESLHDKTRSEKRQQHGHQQRFHILGNRGGLPLFVRQARPALPAPPPAAWFPQPFSFSLSDHSRLTLAPAVPSRSAPLAVPPLFLCCQHRWPYVRR